MSTWLIGLAAVGVAGLVIALLSRAKTDSLGYNLIGKPIGWLMAFDIPYIGGKTEYKLKQAIVSTVGDLFRGALRRIEEVLAKKS